MIDRSWAERYVHEWVADWQAKDLDAILRHYSPEIVFRSPRIPAVLNTQQAAVSGLSELRDYWSKALEAAKEVRFEIINVGVGAGALTILYRNQRNDYVAETLVFDDDGKVIEGIVTYLRPPET
ncbi:nuclear transport factor 2 family protein [Taklimakanibacter deserti]|uniref:nuclear transport factor 2 family protein n=1 Tax=Taklimakanibacter deserti TaxID=2267839 RepID=UPI000E65803D